MIKTFLLKFLVRVDASRLFVCDIIFCIDSFPINFQLQSPQLYNNFNNNFCYQFSDAKKEMRYSRPRRRHEWKSRKNVLSCPLAMSNEKRNAMQNQLNWTVYLFNIVNLWNGKQTIQTAPLHSSQKTFSFFPPLLNLFIHKFPPVRN